MRGTLGRTSAKDVHDALDARLDAIEGEAALGDTREKLEADIEKAITHITRTLMWPPSANKTTEHLRTTFGEVVEWLDRQASITRRELEDEIEREHAQRIAELRGAVCERDGRIGSYERRNAELTAELEAKEQLERDSAYMRLPVDADGVPIRLGDTLAIERGGSTDIGEVTDIHLQEGKCAVSICFEYDSGITAYPEDYRHVQPDTVESLLEEFGRILVPGSAQDGLPEFVAKYAERIRRACNG